MTNDFRPWCDIEQGDGMRREVAGSVNEMSIGGDRLRGRWTLLLIPVLAMFLAGSRVVMAQPDPPRMPGWPPFREVWSFDVSTNAIRQLDVAHEHVLANQWREAIQILDPLLDLSPGELVPLHQIPFAELSAENLPVDSPVPPRKTWRRYLNVELTIRSWLSQWPEAGRKIYRQELDPRAVRWWQEYRTTGDFAAAERIVRRAWLSSVGDDATNILAHRAFEQRDYITARNLWQSLLPAALAQALTANETPLERVGLPQYPDSDLPPADLIARIVLCDFYSANEDQLRIGRSLLEREFPLARGQLGGREGLWIQLIDDLRAGLARMAEAEDSSSNSTRQLLADVTLPVTWGGHPARAGRDGPAFDLGAEVWSAPIPQERLSLFKAQEQRLLADIPPSYPAIWKGLVLVPTATQILAWDVQSGRPAWKSGDDAQSAIYPPTGGETLVPPILPSRGRPAYSLTIADDRLYARLGWPVALQAANETRDLEGQLICLDLGRDQGKLHWRVTPADLFDDGESWDFAGTPVVREDAVYVVVARSRALVDWGLICLDAETGNLRWLTPLGHGRTSQLPNVNQLGMSLATLHGGNVFVTTEPGGVACVEGKTGRLLWGVTVEIPGDEPSRAPYLVMPCVADQGSIFVAPADANDLYAFEASTGAVRWVRPQPEPLSQWVGVADGQLILGGKSLWSFDTSTGRTRWRFLQTEPEWSGYGHGVFSGDSILWPTREALFEIELATGQPTRIHEWRLGGEDRRGGHLAIERGRLVVSQSDRLCVYGEESGIVGQATVKQGIGRLSED
jgi:outer membrane protein assembly factor BamB